MSSLKNKGREMTQWSERQFVRNSYNIWFGENMPKTIAAKELVDNAIDQISDKKSDRVHIRLWPNRIDVMDNGDGISLKKDKTSGKTHLYLAIAKMYTSTNYGGTAGLTGTYGVGMVASNFLADRFKAGHITNKKFTGYEFENGEHSSEGENLDIIEDFADAPMDNGFYVSSSYGDSILEDDIDTQWIINYTKKRTGELREGSIVSIHLYKEEENWQLSEPKMFEFNKITHADGTKDVNYVPSWMEQVEAVKGHHLIRHNGWLYALGKEVGCFSHITSIVQGAPVDCSNTFSAYFDIEDYNVKVNVPFTMFYSGKTKPKYQDQTKQRITVYSTAMMKVLAKSSTLYTYFKQEAEKTYLQHMLKNSGSNMFSPAIGIGNSYKELLIAEGHSAAGGIKQVRNPQSQALLALRGKILNVYGKSLKTAMRSPVVKELLTILTNNKFEKIIICTDADDHGNHICTLLLGLFATFTPHLLREGKVYYCKTPLYIFEKGKEVKWSDDPEDRPKGFNIRTNKGLGSLTPAYSKMFITNPDTREIWRIDYDEPLADEKLYFSLVEGGKRWIADYDKIEEANQQDYKEKEELEEDYEY